MSTTTESRWSFRDVLSRRRRREKREQKLQEQLKEPGHLGALFESVKSGGVPKIKVSGLPVKAPQLIAVDDKGLPVAVAPQELHHDHSPPPGFVLGGDIKPFGMDLPARLYTFYGEVVTGSGVREMVMLGEKLMLKQLLKGFGGEMFGDVGLKHPMFTYQDEEDVARGKPAGLHFEAEMMFDGALEALRETLANVFDLREHTLKVSGHVGAEREWSKPLKPVEFSIKGSFVGTACKVGGILTFTSVGVQLTAARKERKKRLSKQSRYDCGVWFYGTADLEMPGSVVPLVLEYSLKEEVPGSHTLRLHKTGGDWVNAVGFKGLKVSEVQLVAVFPVGAALEELKFEVEGKLQFAESTLTLSGVFAADEFYIETKIPNCSMHDIVKLYSSMTGRDLEDFSHNVQFNDLVFRIDASGVSFSGEVTFDGYRSVEARVEIHRDGIEISGNMENIQVGPLTVESAKLEVFIGRTNPGTTSRESGFAITGNVGFHGLHILVALYTVVEENMPVVWTVYGELEGDLQLSNLAPDVKGSFLDLKLRQVAFIASNQDSPAGDVDFNVFKYPIVKGVQIYAAIDRIKQLDDITGGRVEGLVVRAAYTDQRFIFGVILPTPVTLSLGPNVTSGPIALEVVASRWPQLIVSTSLSVKVAGQSQPLVFTLCLTADLDSIEGSGTMTNYWVSPFGIGENVKIGPVLALEIGVVYAALAAGGPSKFGFRGGLAIGDVETQVALAIGGNPAEQLINASFTKLSVSDLIAFASKIANESIPMPPEDLFTIRDGNFYISTGASIGRTYFPAGVSIRANIELFGKEANFECTVGDTVKIQALFDDIQLGPLTVSGTDGKRLSAVVELGMSKQHILLDGRVKLFEFEASIHAELNILPAPSMNFVMKLAFAEALYFELSASAIGATDIRNLKDADFQIHGVLEQHILEYISVHGQAHFDAIAAVFRDGIEAAEALLNELKAGLDQSLREAEEAFEAAREMWEQKEMEIHEAVSEAVRGFENGLAEFGKELARAEEKLDAALNHAYQRLEQARIDRAAEISSALIKARKVRKELQADIMSQLSIIRVAKEKTARAYGVILQDVEAAEKGVKQAQLHFEKHEKALAEVQARLEHAPFYRHLDLSIKVGHYKGHVQETRAELLAANRALETAQKALKGSGYQTAIAEKAAKKEALVQTKSHVEHTLKCSKECLEKKVEVFDEAVKTSKLAIERQKEPTTGEKKDLVVAERKLQDFKAKKEQEIASLKSKDPRCTSEFAHFHRAECQLVAAKTKRASLELAKGAIQLVRDEDQQQGAAATGVAKSVVDNLHQIFDISHIELNGSLRDLVERGRPLTARIRGTIAGHAIDLLIDYELGRAQDFIKRLLARWWQEVKAKFKDMFDGDDDDGRETKVQGATAEEAE